MSTGQVAGSLVQRTSLARFRRAQQALWLRLPPRFQQRVLWPEGLPRDDWHSFDRKPWQHPWLTPANLRSLRAFSDEWLAGMLRTVERDVDRPGRRYAFVGNIANNLYGRAKAMRDRPIEITTVLHPQDDFLMGQPAWEEYDGDGMEGIQTLDAAKAAGMPLPEVPRVDRHATVPWGDIRPEHLDWPMRFMDLKRFGPYFCNLPTLQALQDFDSILSVQVPYLAYLCGKPYVATQMGGDIWYECSRDDLHGRLQRQAFRSARAFIVSNPWSMAFARRYAMNNMVYLPYLIDEERYSPGEPSVRSAWQAATGGEFFVLVSSRLDYFFKGSHIAIAGFARLAQQVPGARLVLTGWGADQDRAAELFRKLGILDKVLVVPVAGKKKLVSYLRSADCLLDQFTLGYYGASALEAMACGVPVVMNINRVQYDALLPEGAPPVLQASCDQEVAAHLLELQRSPDWRRRAGEQLRNWFLATHSNARWGRLYDAVIFGAARGVLPSFGPSPLNEPLGAEEAAYHDAELAAAPKFPSYV